MSPAFVVLSRRLGGGVGRRRRTRGGGHAPATPRAEQSRAAGRRPAHGRPRPTTAFAASSRSGPVRQSQHCPYLVRRRGPRSARRTLPRMGVIGKGRMTSHVSYLRSTRHPWPCFLFVLPLVLAYESGVLMLGGPHPENLRNGADNWLRVGLMRLGISWVWLPPVVLLSLMAVWTWKRRHERPNEIFAVLSGMVLESVAYAIGLWGISRALGPFLEQFGIELSTGSAEPALGQVITYLGAGIYEEALFRLILFSCLLRLLRLLDV